MRAGLLSQPEVIEKVNERFVSTTITIFDLGKLAQSGVELARRVHAHWSNPVSLMFLTSDGEFVTLLNPVRELTDAHPDTGLRRGQRHAPGAENNSSVFLECVNRYFGKPR
ncbi:MAG TPA: hypothetical protein VMF69_04015 [Gemmataceae bacterium]|nr:hypothetical protein [Gemmataceae bacterium]